jgi:hypothetical protein
MLTQKKTGFNNSDYRNFDETEFEKLFSSFEILDKKKNREATKMIKLVNDLSSLFLLICSNE